MYASTKLAGMLEESNVMEEGIEEGTQMHRGLETTYHVELQGMEGWGEIKATAGRVCFGGDKGKRGEYCT